MKVALYLRVSTRRQELLNQRRQLRRLCQEQGWEIVHEYAEKVSGTSSRAMLEEALKGAERRQYDLLLFWSLDRLSREGTLKTLLYLERLTRAGVNFKSYCESFLDSQGIGELLVPIFAWIARQESLRRGERIRSAFERIRAGAKTRSGRPIGRPGREIALPVLLGAAGRKRQGESWSRIARSLKMPPTTLRAALQKTLPNLSLKNG